MKNFKFWALVLSLSLSTLLLSAPMVLAVDITNITDKASSLDTTTPTETTSTDTDTTNTSTDTTPSDWLTELINKLQTILSTDLKTQTNPAEEQTLESSTQDDAAQAFLTKLTATDSETKQKLEQALSNTPAQNIKTLAGLLDKLPPQASQKVAINIVRSMEKNLFKMEKKEQRKTIKKETPNITKNKVKAQANAVSAEKSKSPKKVHKGSNKAHKGGPKGRN
jgi:hypothetical protein